MNVWVLFFYRKTHNSDKVENILFPFDYNLRIIFQLTNFGINIGHKFELGANSNQLKSISI